MFIINIPSNDNKLNYINALLKKIQSEFDEYTFINCTESPINEYSYFEHNGMYYRNIKNDNNILINEANYIDSYRKEKLANQGISLQEYIEMNMLLELEKILIVSKFDGQIEDLSSLITILICPDGFNELHFSGEDVLLTKIIMFLKDLQMING